MDGAVGRRDAQHLGSLEAEQPARAVQDIPPAIARFVWRRDHGRCQTPGCRSARGLELHHIVARADGGDHDPRNLTLRCSACHAAHHAGMLTIRGTAPDQLETRRLHDHSAPVGTKMVRAPVGATRVEPAPAPAPVGAPRVELLVRAPVGSTRFETATVRTQARDALVALGWKAGIARTAVDAACAHVGGDPEIEVVIREALRRCPVTKG